VVPESGAEQKRSERSEKGLTARLMELETSVPADGSQAGQASGGVGYNRRPRRSTGQMKKEVDNEERSSKMRVPRNGK